MRSSSIGFANPASTTVVGRPYEAKTSEAINESFNLVPNERMQTLLPSLMILPFPISQISGLSFIFSPMPSPLGYLKADGLSFISRDVATLLHNSFSLLGAITIKFGKVQRYVKSKEPACVAPSAPTCPALSIANLTGIDWMAT